MSELKVPCEDWLQFKARDRGLLVACELIIEIPRMDAQAAAATLILDSYAHFDFHFWCALKLPVLLWKLLAELLCLNFLPWFLQQVAHPHLSNQYSCHPIILYTLLDFVIAWPSLFPLPDIKSSSYLSWSCFWALSSRLMDHHGNICVQLLPSLVLVTFWQHQSVSLVKII